MGGSPTMLSAEPHAHQPGQYRGAADLDLHDGSRLFAGYGAPAALQLPWANVPAAVPRVNGGAQSQLQQRQPSNGSDAVTAGSPLSSEFNGKASFAEHAHTHSGSSGGWTGFDGPSYAFACGLSNAGLPAAAPAVAGGSLAGSIVHESAASEQLQQQQLSSLHSIGQHDDLQLHLQRTSLHVSDSELRPRHCEPPFVVTKCLFDSGDSGASPSEVFDIQTLQHCVVSGGVNAAPFCTGDEALPRELIGNLDLYL